MGYQLKLKQETIFRFLIILIWTQTILLQYVRAFIMRLPIIGSYPDAVITVVYIAVILLSIPSYKMTKRDMLFVFAIVLVFVIEWIVYKDCADYIERYMVDFVLKIVPLYVVGISLSETEDEEEIIRQLYILSIVTLIVDIIYQFSFATPMSSVASQYEGNMDRAYKILPHCCLIAYYTVKRTNMWNVVLTIVGGLYILLLGTRGAALIYLISVAVLLIMGRTSKWVIVRIVAIFGAVATFIMSSLYDAAILWLYQFAQKTGLSIRILDKLLTETASQSSGRDIIRETLLAKIMENPFFGYGIRSDHIFAGTYAHNIVIELWVEFGVVIGTALLVAIVVILIRGYLSSTGEGEKGLILSLIFASFCKLLFSGSYLDERLLMLLIGICVGSIRRKKRGVYPVLDESQNVHEEPQIKY